MKFNSTAPALWAACCHAIIYAARRQRYEADGAREESRTAALRVASFCFCAFCISICSALVMNGCSWSEREGERVGARWQQPAHHVGATATATGESHELCKHWQKLHTATTTARAARVASDTFSRQFFHSVDKQTNCLLLSLGGTARSRQERARASVDKELAMKMKLPKTKSTCPRLEGDAAANCQRDRAAANDLLRSCSIYLGREQEREGKGMGGRGV